MSLVEVHEDILNAPLDFDIVHQGNCLTSDMAGAALAIFTKYPWANVYRERLRDGTEDVPGTIAVRTDPNGTRRVITAFGQYRQGKPRSMKETSQMRIQWFKQCLKAIAGLPDCPAKIAFTKIGCGMAGGDWTVYRPILEDFAKKHEIECRVYYLPQKGK